MCVFCYFADHSKKFCLACLQNNFRRDGKRPRYFFFVKSRVSCFNGDIKTIIQYIRSCFFTTTVSNFEKLRDKSLKVQGTSPFLLLIDLFKE